MVNTYFTCKAKSKKDSQEFNRKNNNNSPTIIKNRKSEYSHEI